MMDRINFHSFLQRMANRISSESEPPMGKASDYQPICKFCGEMVDEMVTVYFKQSAQRMCVKCMNDRSHRKL